MEYNTLKPTEPCHVLRITGKATRKFETCDMRYSEEKKRHVIFRS